MRVRAAMTKEERKQYEYWRHYHQEINKNNTFLIHPTNNKYLIAESLVKKKFLTKRVSSKVYYQTIPYTIFTII